MNRANDSVNVSFAFFDYLGVFFMEKFIVMTNNELVKEKYSSRETVNFIEGSLIDVLRQVRDLIHKGHVLLTHPLSGSIKPNETPFKSIMITKKSKKQIDIRSLTMIEDSLKMAEKMLNDKERKAWPERIIKDFSVIDLDLISSAIKSAKN